MTLERNDGHSANVLAASLIVLVTAAAYGNSFCAPFIFDDTAAVVANPTIRELWPVWKPFCPPKIGCTTIGRPVLNASLAVNYAIGGLAVGGYHVTNLAIHLAAVLLLFGIVRRTAVVFPGLGTARVAEAKGKSDSIARALGLAGPTGAATAVALTAALLWAVHPLQTESVTYIVQCAESLMGLFYLLTFYCFLRGARSGRPTFWYAGSVSACVLGMATKEVTVSVPLVVLLYDRTFLAGSFRGAWQARWRYYLALAASWLLLAWLVVRTGHMVELYGQHRGGAWYGWREYLATQPGVIVHYLRLAFWPSGLCLDYNWPMAKTLDAVVYPAILLIGLLALTAWAMVKRPAWGFLAPASS